MDESTQHVLELLAKQLNTTVSHLWQVMLAQAPINSAIAIGEFALAIALIWGIKRGHKKFLTGDSWHDDEVKFWAATSIIALTVVTLIAFLCSFETIVAGFINPEYWALQKFLAGFHK